MARPTGQGVGEADTPLWLSHHAPVQYDRCTVIGRRHVCRRCLFLYPIALAFAVVSCAGLRPASAVELLVLALLPLPAVIDWWLEHLGRSTYEPRRQILVTIPAGVALGVGFGRYLRHPADPAFWAMVLVYGGSCAAVALWRFLEENAP